MITAPRMMSWELAMSEWITFDEQKARSGRGLPKTVNRSQETKLIVRICKQLRTIYI